jgi:hypothetical protein
MNVRFEKEKTGDPFSTSLLIPQVSRTSHHQSPQDVRVLDANPSSSRGRPVAQSKQQAILGAVKGRDLQTLCEVLERRSSMETQIALDDAAQTSNGRFALFKIPTVTCLLEQPHMCWTIY